ncbi:MAG: methyltransferase domain-containing protein [Candidatus Dormibacteria bacterium]
MGRRSTDMSDGPPSIGVLVVAYNAASTLAGVLDRIPPSLRPRITEVIVADDSSSDATYLVGLGYKQLVPDLPLTVIRNERNLGYGGNQKLGYSLAKDHGLDIVVLLHGDGQYAPELLPEMVAPLERGECDAVFGSRMLVRGAARKGGMPLYKLVGNRILTRLENAMLGTNLSEFHSGYRAYSVAALQEIDFMSNSDGFDFDTEIIIQLHDRRMRIREIPIPTYYGDEICYVNGLRYARDVLADVVRYRMSKVGPNASAQRAQSAGEVTMPKEYTLKDSPWSSHGRMLSWLAGRSPRKVLDLGCSSGLLAAEVRRMGHEVTGVDMMEFPAAGERMDHFVQANLDEGVPAAVGGGYDVVIAGDVLEHVRHPDLILRQIRELLAPGGLALVSIPNFSHWYPRFRVLAGRFDYDDQGILDRGHVRFFTRRSFERLVRSAGMRIRRTEAIGVPFERLTSSSSRMVEWASRLDRVAAMVYPSLFAYQYLFELSPERGFDAGQAEARFRP